MLSVYKTDPLFSGDAYMQPHHWALDVEQSTFKTITVSQIDSSHPHSSPAVISLVTTLDRLLPEVPDAAIAILAEADVDQVVAELVIRLKVRGRIFGGPLVDIVGEQVWCVPASQRSCTFGLVV